MAKTGLWPINLTTTITKFDLLQDKFGPGVRARVKTVAEQVLEDSKTISPSCPIDTGDLISTGRVEQRPGGHAVVYGGESDSGNYVTYANQVHDDLRPRRYTVPGSGPKFVEIHYLRRTDNVDAELEDTVMKLVKGIFG